MLALVVLLTTGSATCRWCGWCKCWLVVFVVFVERFSVEICACLAGHRIQERESFERGCIDFFAGDECRFARQTQRDLTGSAISVGSPECDCDLDLADNEGLSARVCSFSFDDDSGEHCVVSRRRYWPASLVAIALHLVDGEARVFVDIDRDSLQFDSLYAEGVYAC